MMLNSKQRLKRRLQASVGLRSKSLKSRSKVMNTPNSQVKKNTPERADADDSGATTGKEAALPEAAGNVDKIRDILFGSQMRDYEKKFARVEERPARETGELREEIRRRFASLEAYMKNELTALAD
jgi:hypothetical protein